MVELNINLITKITSFIYSGLIYGLAIWDFVTVFDQGWKFALIEYIFMDINLIILASLLFLSELEYEIMKEQFLFIAQIFGRGLYIFFVGTYLTSYSSQFEGHSEKQYCMFVGITGIVLGCVYCVLYFMADKISPAPAK
ncbi:hypothetical protein pb186bvf_002522 [Paramecium bursaria]